MRILIHASDYYPTTGGVQVAVANLAKQWLACGQDVRIITSKPNGPVRSREVLDGIEVQRLNWQRRPLWSLAPRAVNSSFRIAATVVRWRPDIVYAHFLPTNLVVLLLISYLLRFRLIVSARGNDVMAMPEQSAIHRWVIIKLFRRAHASLFCSESLLASSQGLLQEADRKGQVLGDGVDLGEVDAAEPWTADYAYIFAMGRFVKKKGFDLLIEAFALLHESYPQLRLVLAGDGEERQRIEALIQESGMEPWIELTGFLGRGPTLSRLKGAEFFVLPSRNEPFGIAVLEAMAASKPILATKVDNIPFLIENGWNGLVVEPTVEAIHAGMLRLLAARGQWPIWGSRGRSIVVDKHTWSQVALRGLDLFEGVLRAR